MPRDWPRFSFGAAPSVHVKRVNQSNNVEHLAFNLSGPKVSPLQTSGMGSQRRNWVLPPVGHFAAELGPSSEPKHHETTAEPLPNHSDYHSMPSPNHWSNCLRRGPWGTPALRQDAGIHGVGGEVTGAHQQKNECLHGCRRTLSWERRSSHRSVVTLQYMKRIEKVYGDVA